MKGQRARCSAPWWDWPALTCFPACPASGTAAGSSDRVVALLTSGHSQLYSLKGVCWLVRVRVSVSVLALLSSGHSQLCLVKGVCWLVRVRVWVSVVALLTSGHSQLYSLKGVC